jgi:hypothetical protein
MGASASSGDLVARIEALEAELAELRRASQAANQAAPEPRDVPRRSLLWAAGAAAAGAAGTMLASPTPAGAQPAPTASDVTFTPTGGIAATNVQAALAELDSEKALGAWIDLRQVGGAGNGSSDNQVPLNNAIGFLSAVGGGMVLIPAGKFRFSGVVTVLPGVSLWGVGGADDGGNMKGSILEAMDNTSQLVVQGRGGVVGNFAMNGRKSAVTGTPAKGFLYLDEPTERQFLSLNVHNVKGTAVVADNLQNAVLSGCTIQHCDGDGLVLDDGSASNSFVRCEINAIGGNGILIRKTTAAIAPYNNIFSNCMVEREGDSGANNTQLTVNAGNNTFQHCWFHLGTGATSGTGFMVNLTGGLTAFDGCTWDGETAGITALRTAAGVEFSGRNYINAAKGVQWDSGAWGRVLGLMDFGDRSGPPGDTRWVGSGSAGLAFQTDRPHLLFQEDNAPYALRVARRSEASTGFRFEVTNTGEIRVNDGTNFNDPRARLRHLPNGRGWEELSLGNATATPTLPADSSRSVVYVKGGKLIVAYRDGATQRYKYLDLVGTAATWVHSTVAP